MTKESLRTELLGRRRARIGEAENSQAGPGEALAAHALSLGVLAGAVRVAAYVSMASEPPTQPLIEGLQARGCEVIVPITGSHRSLDWTLWDRDANTRVSAVGTAEPEGERLGTNALTTCDLIVVPALAIDHRGYRLGRGGGYYDKALSGARAPIAALLFDGEILTEVPRESHDVPVDFAICPGGVFRILQ